jgi:hypothetical protein
VEGTIAFHIRKSNYARTHRGTHRGGTNRYPESVAPTAISGNKDSNAESKISMNR